MLLYQDRLGFFPLPLKLELTEKISSVVCSAGLTLMLSEGGNVYSLGLNRWGQCGMHDPSIKSTESLLTIESKGLQHVYSPIHVTALPPAIIDVDAGLQHGYELFHFCMYALAYEKPRGCYHIIQSGSE